MRLPIFALPLLALSALSFTACSVPIDTEAGTGVEVDEKGCPTNGFPDVGAACDKDAVCSVSPGKADCDPGPAKEVVCAGGLWNIYSPLACTKAGALTCDPVGKWHAAITGSYEYGPTSAGSFNGYSEVGFQIVKSADGVLRVADFDSGDISPDGCKLTVNIGLDHSCSDQEGESSCESWTATVALDLSKDPVDGQVTVTCTGECSIDATAPIQAEKKP